MARVLIIGATSAIAGEVARRFAARGDRLYLLGRNEAALQGLAAELGACVEGVGSGDFIELPGNGARVEEAIATLGGIDICLIAHGLLGDQLRSEIDFGEAERILHVNFTSIVSFALPVANVIELQGSGTLAVMSSVAADRGRPRNYTYAAAKAGANGYLQGIRSRIWRAGGRVVILKLGPVHTPMTADHPKNPLFAQPEAVARSIERAIAGRRSEVYIPGYWRPIMAVVRLLPEVLFQRISFLSGR